MSLPSEKREVRSSSLPFFILCVRGMPPVRILTGQPSLANNPFGPHPFNTTFEEFLSRPCIDKSAFSNSFEAEALLPILNKRKKRGPPSLVEEGGGKRRFVAIGNWVNQRLRFAPYHDWLMKVLRLIPMDGTFDQTRPLDRLKGVSYV